jgi:hypothetical protein
MTLRRAPLPAFAPASEAARLYEALWTEMEARMAGRPTSIALAAASRFRDADPARQAGL